jgi:hypothetical protein
MDVSMPFFYPLMAHTTRNAFPLKIIYLGFENRFISD